MNVSDPRFARQIERLHQLGPRPVGEFMAEIAAKIAAQNPALEAEFRARLERYASLSPEAVRDLGGERFPATPLLMVKS